MRRIYLFTFSSDRECCLACPVDESCSKHIMSTPDHLRGSLILLSRSTVGCARSAVPTQATCEARGRRSSTTGSIATYLPKSTTDSLARLLASTQRTSTS